jgi:hypothetical protein
MVLEKIFKDLAILGSFSLPARKLFGISEPYEQILKRTTFPHPPRGYDPRVSSMMK